MDTALEKLIIEMTIEEKVSLLAGADMWHSQPIERLGIPTLRVSDGPHGVRGAGGGATSISFPVGSAMGATWNTELIGRVGKAFADELKSKGAHIVLGPTVNMHRSPIAGRNFECYSEDPYLSQRLAVSYIENLQEEGVGACVKHYVCNEQEFERKWMSSDVSERALREIYLPPFEGAVREAKSWTIMSAYNRVNGTWASEHDRLLMEILKDEWGFEGLVISDWYGTYSPKVVTSGVDLEMPGPGRWMSEEHAMQALSAGKIDTAHIDDKVYRLLHVLKKASVFDDPELKEPQAVDKPEHRELVREVGGEAIVLLKNEGGLLPLDFPNGGKLAVIGANAKATQVNGGGSSHVSPHYVISPLDGILEQAGGKFEVEYALGAPLHRELPAFSGTSLHSPDGQEGVLKAEFFDNLEFEGESDLVNYHDSTNLEYFGQTADHFDPTHFSLRLSGEISVEGSGKYELTFSCIGQTGRLVIDGESVVELERTEPVESQELDPLTESIVMSLEAGRRYPLKMEYVTLPDILYRQIRLGCYRVDQKDPVEEAVELAKRADKVVIVAGLTPEWEREDFDRADMRLPNRQDELIEKVAAVNPNVVVVLNVASPVEMPWVDKVSSILQMWYLGQETGNALADVLFGNVNPSGKLPTTFPKRLEDNPTYINFPGENGHVLYGEGLFVGYRYYEKKKVEPLFPFGHGLSFTEFNYGKLSVPVDASPEQAVVVSCEVKNIGKVAGKEVVQLYVRDLESSLQRPVKELKEFKKIELQPGESKVVEFQLEERSFAYYDDSKAAWVVEPGEFEIMIGASSQDIRLTGKLMIGSN